MSNLDIKQNGGHYQSTVIYCLVFCWNEMYSSKITVRLTLEHIIYSLSEFDPGLIISFI